VERSLEVYVAVLASESLNEGADQVEQQSHVRAGHPKSAKSASGSRVLADLQGVGIAGPIHD